MGKMNMWVLENATMRLVSMMRNSSWIRNEQGNEEGGDDTHDVLIDGYSDSGMSDRRRLLPFEDFKERAFFRLLGAGE